MHTIRQQVIELLKLRPMTVRELSQELAVMEKEIYSHLEHIALSVKADGLKLHIDPAICLGCSYSFHKRTRVKPPGRCPKCRGTHIQKPTFSVCNRR